MNLVNYYSKAPTMGCMIKKIEKQIQLSLTLGHKALPTQLLIALLALHLR